MKNDAEELIELAEMLERKAKTQTMEIKADYCLRKAELCRRAAAALGKKRKPKPEKKPCRIPTREEAIAYAVEIFLPKREAEGFCDYFASNGWKVGGRTPMKDWKAALRNWRRNWEERNPEEARMLKSVNAKPGDSDPVGWKDWLVTMNIPFTPFASARGYLRDDFKNRKVGAK